MAAGLVEPADSRISIAEPKSGWPTEFETSASAVREALGDLALRIDHIGSTAVAGLPAKDVIDIQVTVASLDRDRLVPLLAHARFVDRESRGPDWLDRAIKMRIFTRVRFHLSFGSSGLCGPVSF